jgi:hypothetical protein
MTKKILLLSLITGLAYVMLTSYSTGVGYNCTGAKGSVTTCGGSGSSCHGSSTRTTAAIRVDSTGNFWVGAYVPGMTYTVTVSGTNPYNLPVFGFQFTAVKGSGTAQTMAGTYAGFPVNVNANLFSGLLFVSHTQALNAPIPGTYQESFQWVAPPAGSGPVTMYLTLLAANGNNYQDTNDVSANIFTTLYEHAPSIVAQPAILNSISLFPNPVTNILHVTTDVASTQAYCITACDINGSHTCSYTWQPGPLTPAAIDMHEWKPGMYIIMITGGDQLQKQFTIVKQ